MDSRQLAAFMMENVVSRLSRAIDMGLDPRLIMMIWQDIVSHINETLFQAAIDRGEFTSGYSPAA